MIERKGTKQLIAESFVELLGSAKIKDITVGDIARNCGVSSRTFYYHFADKFELVEYVYEMQLRQAAQSWGDYRSLLLGSVGIVESLGTYVEHSTESVPGVIHPLDRMADCSVRVYREIIEERLDPEVLTDKVLFELYYYNYLTLKAYMDWTISSSGRSGECLVDYVLACMPPDLEPILNCGKATDSQ